VRLDHLLSKRKVESFAFDLEFEPDGSNIQAKMHSNVQRSFQNKEA